MTKHDYSRPQRILEYVHEADYPPSVREIMEAVDLASTSAVHHHLVKLERQGLIERASRHSGVRLTVKGRSYLGDTICEACHGTGVA